jgi:hypothetical protein
MLRNEDELNKLTGNLFAKAGTEDPSELFTEKIMQSVLASETPFVKLSSTNYLWFLLFVPVIFVGGWYLSVTPVLMDKFTKYLDPISHLMDSTTSFIMGYSRQLLNISSSPLILVGMFSAFFLLIIDSFLSRRNIQH